MILVTGAAGHLGNVLVRELLADEKKIRALVLPGEDTGSLAGMDIEIVEGDVLDGSSLNAAMQGIDIVFHMAGIIAIMPGQDELMRRVNVQGTRNVVEAALQSGVKRLVYTSSIHALSRDWKGKIDEQVPFDPSNPAGEYDRTKAEASVIVLDAVKRGLDAVIVCPTGVIGPHDYRGSEMGDLLRNFMRIKPHFMIEGAFDFVDVRDVAQGHIRAAEKGRTGEVYILSGWNIKFNQLKQMVQDFIGSHSPNIDVPQWAVKIAARMAPLYYKITRQTPTFTEYAMETVQGNSDVSCDKARRELGYSPRLMITTVGDTVRWWLARDRKNHAK
jgi:dihydroflavonol-4-reductase